MERTTVNPIRKKKKTLNACQRCRNGKIKCSGQNPCQSCVSRSVTCIFVDRPKKLVVSEDYIQDLQNRALRQDSMLTHSSPSRPVTSVTTSNDVRAVPGQEPHSSSTASIFSPGSSRRHQHRRLPEHPSSSARPISYRGSHEVEPSRSNEGEGSNQQQNPVESQYAIGDEYRRLGHSSSWSFSRRIRNMINDAIGGPELHDMVPIRDGAYGVPWRQKVLDLSSRDLPAQDYAEYLLSTFCFTMDPLYYLFDKTAFLNKMRRFYEDSDTGREQNNHLWHIQLIVVFAFGKSILAREASPSGPTGALYFAKAVEALPDNFRLCQEPILSIEILCLFALFMQAMDMRLAASNYIGQAVRIALSQGLNRIHDDKLIDLAEFEHRTKLWWTIYIIDHKLSSLLGVPSALHDEDIAVAMPSTNSSSQTATTMALHVELSSQLGQILNVVYGLGLQRQLGGKFVAAIQSILHRIAETSMLLDSYIKIELQQPTDSISRPAASLHLLHHQCSILTIRPVLFYLLEKKLANNNSTLTVSDAVIGLLRVCVESALQILKIIETLRSHKLVDLLLPYDLEALYAAAFILVLVDIITPAAAGHWDLSKTFKLIDEMTIRGFVTAEPYKNDLIELNELRQRLRQQPTLCQQNEQSNTSVPSALGMSAGDVVPDPHIMQDAIWPWMTTGNNNMGVIYSETIQSAIEGLNFDFLNDPAAIELGSCEWMWESEIPDSVNWTDAI